MAGSELYVPPEDGVPHHARDGFWFRVGWKWATSTAVANGWLKRDDAVMLEQHGDRLWNSDLAFGDEAKRRREGGA